MGMTISILGGVGLFLLGMAVMTEGLRALAGSALRAVLAKAAATPLRGTLWGALVTLMVQSSSATTMTTIGLVSAGLLTFPQGLSLVFGANVGTTGTGWLVALLGVRVSLTAAALPMIFVGAMFKLLGKGRWAGAGSALAGFGLLLFGLTTLQEGMGGLAERMNPADLPHVGAGDGTVWVRMLNVLILVAAGAVMTTLMQSSSAAIAVTLSALHAGAVDPDQAIAMVTGQNVGTAVSSALAAIGTTTPAKRTAVAYILFKLTTAVVALLLFPLIAPLVNHASKSVDAVAVVAAYHTGYNVLGVAMLLPIISRFARLVERIVPQRGPALTRHLDRSVLAVPAVAVEAARRAVAGVLGTLSASLAATIESRRDSAALRADSLRASEALDEVQLFLAQLGEPPASAGERRRLASTLHALDHTSRLAGNARETVAMAQGDREDAKADATAVRALLAAAEIAAKIGAPAGPTPPGQAEADSLRDSIASLAATAAELAEFRREQRKSTLDAAANGAISSERAIARVERVRYLDRLAYHAWRAAAHLADTPDAPKPEPHQPTPVNGAPEEGTNGDEAVATEEIIAPGSEPPAVEPSSAEGEAAPPRRAGDSGAS